MGLSFEVLSSDVLGQGVSRYVSAFETFRLVWEQTFRSLNGEAYVQYSDDFTKQDYVQCIFDGTDCAGLDCVRRVDIRNPVYLKDSWLKAWPSKVLNSLSRTQSTALINSFFTVHPSYRKSSGGRQSNISYVLGCLSVLYQLELEIPLMLGMMRNDRSMNKQAGRRMGRQVFGNDRLQQN
jgi:hypothetical protein